jgi:hypothetical protein
MRKGAISVEIHFPRALNFFYQNPISQRTNEDSPPPGCAPPGGEVETIRIELESIMLWRAFDEITCCGY